VAHTCVVGRVWPATPPEFAAAAMPPRSVLASLWLFRLAVLVLESCELAAVAAQAAPSAGGLREAVSPSAAESPISMHLHRRRELLPLLSDHICERVCASLAPSGTAPGASAAAERLPTQYCAGALRLAPCCQCIDEGYKVRGAANAFLHLCIPTTPRESAGQELGFLDIVLSALDEQIRDQARSPGAFGGVCK
jgi:hypothetical protein